MEILVSLDPSPFVGLRIFKLSFTSESLELAQVAEINLRVRSWGQIFRPRC